MTARLEGLVPVVVSGRWSAIGARETGVTLVEDVAEIRWLTGFTGSSGCVLADWRAGTGILFTDGRYEEQAREEITACGAPVEVRLCRTRASALEALSGAAGTRKVAIDPSHVTVARWEELKGAGLRVGLAGSPITSARRSKDAAEQSRMAAAASIATAALEAVVGAGLEGRTEGRVAADLVDHMTSLGAQGAAYDTIVASGPNGARAHHRAGSRTIREGDAVVIDVGARVDGYCSDMTRTFFVGDVDPFLGEMHELVRLAQERGVAAVVAGVPARDVDRACREVFAAAGHEALFVHGTGHGVGLEIHEEPFLGPATEDLLLAGEVVTVEPGLYREGLGGVRIEDLVVVTREGVRNLTEAPKDPTCPPSRRTT